MPKNQEQMPSINVDSSPSPHELTLQDIEQFLITYFQKNYQYTLVKTFFFNRRSFIRMNEKTEVLRLRLQLDDYSIDCHIHEGKSGLIGAFIPSIQLKKQYV